MTEKQEQQSTSSEVVSQKKAPASRESLFGTLLFGGIMVLVLIVVGLLGFWGYRGFRAAQNQETLPSITALPMTEEKQVTPPVIVESQETKEEPTSEELTKKVKGTEIKVLNGGAAKGSAAVVGDALKKDGYTKVTVGNTTGNYTGTVVYFTSGLDKEADIVKNALLKSYPKIQAKAAMTENKETSAAPLTVILGKE